MSTSVRRLHYTYAEYRAIEDESPIRHEYLDGEIYAMAGGTPDHAALAAAVIRVLGPVLPRSCRAFSSDLRVRVVASGLSTYPDVSIVCGRTLRASDDALAVTNPVLLVEITSSSTEDYDRGEKLLHYKKIPSVHEVMILAHAGPRVTVHRREDGDRWIAVEAGPGETVQLLSVATSISIDALYRDALEDTASAPDVP